MSRRMTAVCFALSAHLVMACCCMSGEGKSTDPIRVADEKSQADRLKIIEGYQRENVIDKVDGPNKVAKLWVKPLFYTLPFEDKKTLAKIVYAWYYKTPNNPKDSELGLGDHVQILDHRSGKKVGEYSMLSGLSMDK